MIFSVEIWKRWSSWIDNFAGFFNDHAVLNAVAAEGSLSMARLTKPFDVLVIERSRTGSRIGSSNMGLLKARIIRQIWREFPDDEANLVSTTT